MDKDKATELAGVSVDDKPKVGFIGKLFQIILVLLAFFFLLAGFYVQTSTIGFERIGTFTDGLPCYIISFLLLICMIQIQFM